METILPMQTPIPYWLALLAATQLKLKMLPIVQGFPMP